MSQVTLKGNPVQVAGQFPTVGQTINNFASVADDLSEKSLTDFSQKRKILNIFPSVDTGVCAQSVRTFNEKASNLDNTVVLCVSADLPFAQKRFCAAEGLENVYMLSLFRNPEVKDALGVNMTSGPLAGLAARAVIVLDEQNKVIYSQLVPEITTEPDYDAALAAL